MSIDPQMQAVLDAFAEFHAPPPNTVSVEVARAGPTPADAVKKLLISKGKDPAPQAVGSVRDLKIPGPAGDIQARCYVPAGDGPFPVLVYFHGGGWVIANLDTYDSSARAPSGWPPPRPRGLPDRGVRVPGGNVTRRRCTRRRR